VGVVRAVEPGGGPAEITMCPGLGGTVLKPPRRAQGGLPDDRDVVPVSSLVEEGVEAPGQSPGLEVVPVGGGTVEGGEQDGTLDGEPVQRPHSVGQLSQHNAGRGRGEDNRVASRREQAVGGVGDVHVVVEHAPRCGLPIVGGVFRAGEFGRVDAKQVVERVSAGLVFGDEVSPGEFGQQGTHLIGRTAGEARGGSCGQPDRTIQLLLDDVPSVDSVTYTHGPSRIAGRHMLPVRIDRTYG
jgi:hypothetical protein